MPKHILIVVACHNRPDLTGLTLDQIERQKSSISDVLVVSDGSTEFPDDFEKRWPAIEFLWAGHVGVAQSARRRIGLFLSPKWTQKFLLTLDNDVLLAKHFDLKALNYWNEAKGMYPHARILLSGYRSIGYVPVGNLTENLISVEHVGGLFHFISRPDAEHALKAMDEQNRWDERMWDRNFCESFQHLLTPKRSLAEHTGRHGSGHNGYSEDMAVDFEGYAP